MNHGDLFQRLREGKNGYRIYTSEHEVYFECIRALNAGFGMDLVKGYASYYKKEEYMMPYG